MPLPEHVLLTYGYLLLFAWVLTEQLGLPLPATPALMAAGALSAEKQISFPLAMLLAVVAVLIADTTWFFIGRRHGQRVLRMLCKLSMEPTTCVRRTKDSFGRRRGLLLMSAKFVPGLGMSDAAGSWRKRDGVVGIFDLRRHWGIAVGGSDAGDRPVLRRPAEPQPEPAGMGRTFFRGVAGSGNCGILPGAALAAAQCAETTCSRAAGTGRAETAARFRRAGLYRGSAPSAGAAAGPVYAAGRAYIFHPTH